MEWNLETVIVYDMFISKLCGALSKAKINYAIVGGYAVALHGAIRGTVDIDLIIENHRQTFIKVEKALKKIGLKALQPISAENVWHNKKQLIEQKNMIAWNFYNPDNPLEQVDIIINYELHLNAIVNIETSFGMIPVLNKKELIKMKSQSNRQQDIIDIKELNKLWVINQI